MEKEKGWTALRPLDGEGTTSCCLRAKPRSSSIDEVRLSYASMGLKTLSAGAGVSVSMAFDIVSD